MTGNNNLRSEVWKRFAIDTANYEFKFFHCQENLVGNDDNQLFVCRRRDIETAILKSKLYLEQQLQAKEEEIEEVKGDLDALQNNYAEVLAENWKLSQRKSNKEIKSLQSKLQQAKEGLEFYANYENFQFMGRVQICRKARETLEIIKKD